MFTYRRFTTRITHKKTVNFEIFIKLTEQLFSSLLEYEYHNYVKINVPICKRKQIFSLLSIIICN